MKKPRIFVFVVAFMATLLMGLSCDKLGQEVYYDTFFVASVKDQPTGYYYVKILGQGKQSVSFHDPNGYGKLWFLYPTPIEGFDIIYEEGNEYIISVKITYQRDGSKTVSLEGIIMKNRAETVINPDHVQYVNMCEVN